MPVVPLSNFGGLVASMDVTSLPEGASPRNWDVDYVTGGFRQRPGQQNAFSFTGQSQGPNAAFSAVDTSLGYAVWQNPTNILLNDGNYASVAIASSTTLTPTRVVIFNGVVSGIGLVCQVTFTFSTTPPAITSGQTYTFSNLGPSPYNELDGTFTPNSVSGNTNSFIFAYNTYASTPFGGATLTSGSASVSAVTTQSDYLDVTNFTFSVPVGQSISGIGVSLKGYSSNAQTANVQLLDAGSGIGAAKTYTLPASVATQSLGSNSDGWSASLTPAIANAANFGVRIWVTGAGTAFFDYVTITLYLTAANVNFNYCGTILSPTGIKYNLALDAQGNWWLENTSTAPDQLTEILSGTTAGSFGSALAVYNRAFVTNLTLTGQVTGADIPRQYNFEQQWWDRVTQIGPALAPTVTASQASGAIANITSISVASNVATITAANSYTAGEVGTFAGLVDGTAPAGSITGLNGQTLIVLSTGLSSTAFEVSYNNGGVSTGAQTQTATFTPQYTYPVASITQPAQQSDPSDPGHFNGLLWSSGPGSTSSGNTITVYYSNAFDHSQPDTTLVNAFNAGFPVYVRISGAPFGNGVWQVTSVGMAIPPHGEYGRWYFTYQVPTANYQFYGGPDSAQGNYQITQGTVTLSSPVPGLAPGSQVSIAGASVTAWDGNYSIVEALNSGAYSITQTAISAGTATYTWSLISGSAPAAGQLVTVTGTLNANGALNVAEAVIASATGSNSGTFTINGFAANLSYPTTVEQGQATTAGTEFIIDPGAALVGSTSQNPILGNSTGGTLTIVGVASGGTLPIGAGTRQGVILFVTRNGLYTAPGPPTTFTVAVGSNYIQASNIPIGPPNVIARLFACTEAGQNGIPGANFYTTTIPTTFTVGGVTYVSSSFLIPDNTTTTAKFTFSDFVLLQGDAIDQPGNNLFNLVEIGNPAKILQYADRTFYIGCQNKVQNFNNLSFDGGYIAPVGSAPAVPGGWNIDPSYAFAFGTSFSITSFSITSNVVTIVCSNTLTVGLNVGISGLAVGTYLNGAILTVLSATSSQFTASFTHANVTSTADTGTAKPICNTIVLRPSPVFGNSLYVQNQTASTQAILGMITQSAYQDAWNEPILNPQGVPVPYSVRVVCRTPSGGTGNIVVDLVASNQSGYGASYGSFTIPLSSMTNQMQTFTGALTSSSGIATIPSGLLIRVYGTSMAALADFEIDRIEVFPTNQPVLTNQVWVSYPQQPEQVDGTTGLLVLNSRNQQPVYGATIIRDQLVFKKADSMIEVEDSPNYEPAQWTSREISETGSGACGPNAFAQGDEWDLGINERGIYIYDGGVPGPISRELQGYPGTRSLWDTINWGAKQTFWMVNDLKARRFYCGVAMTTPNQWLPNAATNATPQTPNVILMCNYDGCPTPQELAAGAPVHVTIFGSTKALDMRRKWSIWQIACPYAGIVYDSTYFLDAIFLGNGINSGKIYRLLDCSVQDTDDGAAISWDYCTYGQPGDEKAQMMQLGEGQKYASRWMLQVAGSASANQLKVTHYPNTLSATYPVKAAFIPALVPTQQNPIEWRAEVRGQRIMTEFSMTGPGWAEITGMMTEIQPHAWGTFRGVSS